MGTWGNGLFDDDLALDIKGEFEQLLEEGKPAMQAAESAFDRFAEVREDPDEGPVLVLALASLMADNGVKEHTIISEAINVLQEEKGLERWREAGPGSVRKPPRSVRITPAEAHG